MACARRRRGRVYGYSHICTASHVIEISPYDLERVRASERGYGERCLSLPGGVQVKFKNPTAFRLSAELLRVDDARQAHTLR